MRRWVAISVKVFQTCAAFRICNKYFEWCSNRFEIWGGGMEWYKPITNLVSEPVSVNTWVRVAARASQTQNNNINRLIWKVWRMNS